MAYYERTGSTAPAQPTPPSPSYTPEYDSQIEMSGMNQSRKTPVVKLILGVFVCFGLVAALIYSNVQQLQLNNQITALEQEYTDLQSENVRMQSELAGRTSSKNIQEYAENVLGMNALSKSQIEYVQIQTDDVVEIPEEEQNIFVRIKIWFDNLVEYLRG